MDQTFPRYLMLAASIVLFGYCAGDIQCNHSCLSDKTCDSRKIEDTCYYMFKDKRRNWPDNQLFCVDQKLSMVKLTQAMIEQNQIYNFSGLIQDVPQFINFGAWLGGRAVFLSVMIFVNNVTAKSTILGDDGTMSCAAFLRDGNVFTYGFGYCSQMRPFVCKLNRTSIQQIVSPKTWSEARSYCLELGVDWLYLYENETFNSFENDLGLTAKLGVHIGFRRRIWLWTDESEVLFTNLAQSVSQNPNHDCLYLWENGKTSSDNCSAEKQTFCQGDATGQGKQDTPAEVKKQLSPLTILVIVLGSRLGVFVIITISLVIFFVYMQWARKTPKPPAIVAFGYEKPVFYTDVDAIGYEKPVVCSDVDAIGYEKPVVCSDVDAIGYEMPVANPDVDDKI